MRILVLTLGLLLAAVQVAWAGGGVLLEMATPEVGLAGAGRGARAQDASVAFRNPAGMGHLDRSQLLMGLQPMWLRAEFELGSGTTVSGGDGGDAGSFIPGLASYYVHRFDEHWSAGLSLNSSFGSGFDYHDSWAGRYVVQEVELITLGLTPALGYRINDWLSVGAGFSAVFGKLDQKTAIVFPGEADAKLELESKEWGFGAARGSSSSRGRAPASAWCTPPP